MKHKVWTFPLISLLICAGIFLLAGLAIIISKNIGVAIIAVMVTSVSWTVTPSVASFIYGYTILKNAQRKAGFVLYNALLHAATLVALGLFSQNAFTLIFSVIIIPFCVLPTVLGLLIAKKNERETEYSAQFDGVSMENNTD